METQFANECVDFDYYDNSAQLDEADDDATDEIVNETVPPPIYASAAGVFNSTLNNDGIVYESSLPAREPVTYGRFE